MEIRSEASTQHMNTLCLLWRINDVRVYAMRSSHSFDFIFDYCRTALAFGSIGFKVSATHHRFRMPCLQYTFAFIIIVGFNLPTFLYYKFGYSHCADDSADEWHTMAKTVKREESGQTVRERKKKKKKMPTNRLRHNANKQSERKQTS